MNIEKEIWERACEGEWHSVSQTVWKATLRNKLMANCLVSETVRSVEYAVRDSLQSSVEQAVDNTIKEYGY
jgi:hypothetical protein